jgi:hypothetical protein
MKSKSLHPADAADRAAIPSATSFIASLFLGTGQFAKSEAKTIKAARAEAEHLAAYYRNGRKALVYAILPNGRQVLVPSDYEPNAQPTEDTMAAKSKATAKKTKTQRAAKPAASKKTKTKPVIESEQTAAVRPLGKRAAIEAAARDGKLPEPPDFSAETHKRFRNKLASVVDLAKAGDLKGLHAFEINPVNSSPKAIARYRDLCVIALEAQVAR